MSILTYLWGSLADPTPTIQYIKEKGTLGQALIVLLIGLAAIALIGSALTAWLTEWKAMEFITGITGGSSYSSGYSTPYYPYGYEKPEPLNIFFNTFIQSFGMSIALFVGIVFFMHFFMRAINCKEKIKKFATTLAFPYVSISAFILVLQLIMFGLLKSIDWIGKTASWSTSAATAIMILFFIVIILAVSIYGYILYSVTAKETYNSSLASAAVFMLLILLITMTLFSFLSILMVWSWVGGGARIF